MARNRWQNLVLSLDEMSEPSKWKRDLEAVSFSFTAKQLVICARDERELNRMIGMMNDYGYEAISISISIMGTPIMAGGYSHGADVTQKIFALMRKNGNGDGRTG
jgi:hypothetical protein